ncbi:MAG: DUF2254 domain-containing protein, partial [Verrucomicrobiae bacterium]|nr:DUF2254 domain-containing protein [Verrucomicrobiae bacterium]
VALFWITLTLFTFVILMFVRWVDRIARLGRLGTTIEKVEKATARVFERRKKDPFLGGKPIDGEPAEEGVTISTDKVGYIQQIDMALLQEYAEYENLTITLAAHPGTFATPDKVLARITGDTGKKPEIDRKQVLKAFHVGDSRTFDEDPRFGLIVLSEIASRALSPAVNDPGTAIDVIGSMVRLIIGWCTPIEREETTDPRYNLVRVPAISLQDLFDDAFRPIARDGAGMLEVGIRLQKAFGSLAAVNTPRISEIATEHSRQALEHAKKQLRLPEEIETIADLALNDRD